MPSTTAPITSSSTLSEYTTLPVSLPPQPSLKKSSATHYLYLRPHEPKIPTPESARSLFLVNIPIATTESHLRFLFGTTLAAGRVEAVEFQDWASGSTGKKGHVVTAGGKKRKRETIEDYEAVLVETALPSTWGVSGEEQDAGSEAGRLHASGSHAIVTFVDRPSMESSLKAAKKAAKKALKNKEDAIPWVLPSRSSAAVSSDDEDDITPTTTTGTIPLGLSRYKQHHTLTFPPRRDLLRSVNNYIIAYTQLEEAKARASALKASEPDEDGFVTVVKGPKAVKASDASNPNRNNGTRAEDGEEKKKKKDGLEDFYRFQTREKRKERQGELVKRFEEDRRRVEDMRRKRGKIRVSFVA